MDGIPLLPEEANAAWAVIPLLLLTIGYLLAWFPGHNARRVGHPASTAVGHAGWGVTAVGLLAGLLGPAAFVVPVALMAWVAVVTWSFGKRDAARVTAHSARRAFGVVLPAVPALALIDDDIPDLAATA